MKKQKQVMKFQIRYQNRKWVSYQSTGKFHVCATPLLHGIRLHCIFFEDKPIVEISDKMWMIEDNLKSKIARMLDDNGEVLETGYLLQGNLETL